MTSPCVLWSSGASATIDSQRSIASATGVGPYRAEIA